MSMTQTIINNFQRPAKIGKFHKTMTMLQELEYVLEAK